jgi:hypothetical protein
MRTAICLYFRKYPLANINHNAGRNPIAQNTLECPRGFKRAFTDADDNKPTVRRNGKIFIENPQITVMIRNAPMHNRFCINRLKPDFRDPKRHRP